MSIQFQCLCGNITDESGYICEKCAREQVAQSLRNKFSERPEFQICSHPDYFTNGITDEYPISYRLVLLRILHKIINDRDNLDIGIVKKEFEKLIQSLVNKQEYSFMAYAEYVEIYVFKDTQSNRENSNEVNAILIDKTGGTYPLFFYSKHSRGKKGFRVEALMKSLIEIFTNIENFVEILFEVKEELFENIAYKNIICWKLTDWTDDADD